MIKKDQFFPVVQVVFALANSIYEQIRANGKSRDESNRHTVGNYSSIVNDNPQKAS